MRLNKYLLPLSSLAVLGCTDVQKQMPNIVLIVADDLGLGDVSCYGSRTILTPHIDSLADAGVRFQNCYATSATSTPSRFVHRNVSVAESRRKNPCRRCSPADRPIYAYTPENDAAARICHGCNRQMASRNGIWQVGLEQGNRSFRKHRRL